MARRRSWHLTSSWGLRSSERFTEPTPAWPRRSRQAARWPNWATKTFKHDIQAGKHLSATFGSGRPDVGYLGVPLWHRGHVLGTLCSQYAGDLNSQETVDARRKVLVQLAAKFSAEIDNITERTRITPSPSAPLP